MALSNSDNKNYSIKHTPKNYSIKHTPNTLRVPAHSLLRHWYPCKYGIFCRVPWCSFLGIFILNY